MIPAAERPAFAPFRGGRAWMLAGAGAALIGAVVLVFGFIFARRATSFAYLAAWSFALTTILGAFVFLLIVNTMNATWPVAIRRVNEALAATVPLLALLALPLLLGLRELYPWLSPEKIADEHTRHLIEHKHAYLNLPFFLLRSAFYLVLWSLIAAYLRRNSLRQDTVELETAAATLKRRARAVSAAVTPAVGLTMTFASFDWLMSLTPAWQSTMYGFYYFAGAAVAGVAALTVAVAAAERAGGVPWLNRSHQSALGRLLLTFTIFWAYIAFFQFLLAWIADRPDESSYYGVRAHGPWAITTFVIGVGQFAVPFFLLLNYRLKRSVTFNCAISIWIIIAHYFDIHWLALPAASRHSFGFGWPNVGALLFVVGATVAGGVWLLRGHPLVPRGDPALPPALRYHTE